VLDKLRIIVGSLSTFKEPALCSLHDHMSNGMFVESRSEVGLTERTQEMNRIFIWNDLKSLKGSILDFLFFVIVGKISTEIKRKKKKRKQTAPICFEVVDRTHLLSRSLLCVCLLSATALSKSRLYALLSVSVLLSAALSECRVLAYYSCCILYLIYTY
jgi:hypothetical protein